MRSRYSSGKAVQYITLEIQESPAVEFIIGYGMPRGSLFHELGEDTRRVGGLPLRGHLGEDQIPH